MLPSKSAFHLLFGLPKSSFGEHEIELGFTFTPPKRRLWKAEPTFPNAFPGEALFKGVSTRFGIRIVEIASPGNACGKVGSAFHNLRLGA